MGIDRVAKSTQTHLPIQTHPIINWVKWILTQLNPININDWVLIRYPIDPIMIQLSFLQITQL